MASQGSARGGKTRKIILKKHPDVMKEIEGKILAQVELKKGEA